MRIILTIYPIYPIYPKNNSVERKKIKKKFSGRQIFFLFSHTHLYFREG